MVLARAARRAAQIVSYPAGRVILELWRRSPDLPRRVPNLARFTRRRRFRRIHAAVVPWIAGNFAIIEANAPWLNLAGQHTTDFCRTGLATHALSFPRDRPSVQCQRVVLRVYGVDGKLSGRLDDLVTAISAAGWGKLDGEVTLPLSGLGSLAPPTRPISWRPAPEIGLPSGLELMPAARQFPSWRWIHMQIGWASRGYSTAAVTGLRPAHAADRQRTPVYEPLEVTADGTDDAVRLALATHEHAVGIRIDFSYYIHLNATRGPGRIARRLVPYRPAAG